MISHPFHRLDTEPQIIVHLNQFNKSDQHSNTNIDTNTI
jgi:hypothetical protein